MTIRAGIQSCLNPEVQIWSRFRVLTFVFVYAILGVTSESGNGKVAGLVIGLTGTSVNPARSFGPAILLGGEAWYELWVFVTAPFLGALLAAAAYRLLKVRKACKQRCWSP
uniref:Aquaporin n=1 Tax=Cohnella candidum TaxID=2674991 RepID=A0A3G3K1Q6_9BACL|nr:hypothetical protein EAV92_19060 [Cohnella candidum]